MNRQLAALVVLALAPGMAGVHAQPGGLEQDFACFDRESDRLADMPEARRKDAIAAAYHRCILPHQTKANLRGYSKEELNTLFNAAYDAAFYTLDPDYVRDMAWDVSARERLGSAPRRDYVDLYRALTATRNFAAARNLYARQKLERDGANPLPAIKEEGIVGKPSELAPGENGQALIHQSMLMGSGKLIVVVGHPLCHFSQNAYRYIASHPMLAQVFAGHAKWIMPQNGKLDMPTVLRWNRMHPDAKMAYIFKQSEWPALDSWATPTFYIFDNGTLVQKLVGWPPQGGEKALLDALRAAGMIQAQESDAG